MSFSFKHLRLLSRAVMVCLFAGAIAGQASAQTEYQNLSDEIDRLKRELKDVQREVYSSYSNYNSEAPAAAPAPQQPSAAPPRQASPAVLGGTQRLGEIEDSLRRITGRMEELSFQVNQVSQQMMTLQSDVDFRLKALEQKAGIESIPLTQGSIVQGQVPSGSMALGTTRPSEPIRSADSQPVVMAAPMAQGVDIASRSFNSTVRSAAPGSGISMGEIPGDAQDQYERAKALLMEGNFAGAESAFTSFLNQYADNDLAGEAQYWLAETYYVRGAYRQAGQAFTDGLKKYPKSPRGPDSLLKLGMSLAALNQNDEACSTFKEMDRRYPNAMQTVVQRVKVEKSKAGCR